jgi:hypothetical protein
LLLYKTTIKANPIAVSAATTVSMKKTKICPDKSTKKFPKIIKLKFTDKNINSKDISSIRIFFRFKNIPAKEILKSIELKIK